MLLVLVLVLFLVSVSNLVLFLDSVSVLVLDSGSVLVGNRRSTPPVRERGRGGHRSLPDPFLPTSSTSCLHYISTSVHD